MEELSGKKKRDLFVPFRSWPSPGGIESFICWGKLSKKGYGCGEFEFVL
jgi:hypothetical protein